MERLGLAVCLLWLFQSALAQDTSCYSNTTELFNFVAGTADGSDEVVVVLCPNSVFTIGNLNDNEGQVEGGSMPLIAFPRVQYLCGEDGSSANACVIEGGDIQFWNPPGAAVETVVVSGLTFQEATFVSIYLQGSGQISFIDCIVRVSIRRLSVLLDWT